MEPLNSVEKLSITQIDLSDPDSEPWNVEMARFVDRFPRITTLSLSTNSLPEYGEVLAHLNHCRSSLQLLSLHCSLLFDYFETNLDHLLPRFENLNHLDLCEGTATAELPSYLRQLSHLASLRLGQDTHYAGPTSASLLSLLQGPHRLVALKTFTLDSIVGKVGNQVTVGDEDSEVYSLSHDGWEIPEFHNWDVEECKEMVVAGELNGVRVQGATFEAIGTMKLKDLEHANRLILSAYRGKSLKEYVEEKDSDWPLPDLDVDELDLENLKLIKVDLPELGWFQFTLE